MIIKYRSVDAPNEEKIFDTVLALKLCVYLASEKRPTQEEYDIQELASFERKKEQNFVIEYHIDDQKGK